MDFGCFKKVIMPTPIIDCSINFTTNHFKHICNATDFNEITFRKCMLIWLLLFVGNTDYHHIFINNTRERGFFRCCIMASNSKIFNVFSRSLSMGFMSWQRLILGCVFWSPKKLQEPNTRPNFKLSGQARSMCLLEYNMDTAHQNLMPQVKQRSVKLCCVFTLSHF